MMEGGLKLVVMGGGCNYIQRVYIVLSSHGVFTKDHYLNIFEKIHVCFNSAVLHIR